MVGVGVFYKCFSHIIPAINMLSRRLLRIKAIKSLYSHFQSGEVSLIRSQKEFEMSNRKCYELYLLLLGLVVEVADYAESRIVLAQGKLRPTAEDLNPNRRFVDNQMIQMIRDSQQLADLRVRYKCSWGANLEQLVKELYEQLMQMSQYKLYMGGGVSGRAVASGDFTQDRKIVLDFYRHCIEDNELMEEILEGESIFWIDDLEFALGFVIATLTAVRVDGEDIGVLPMYKNDEDKEFGNTLFVKSLVNSPEYFGYIDELTQNWDFERIAFMDRIIMLAAITEFTQFSSIPVKVTLDEFIEIAKHYSTPASGQFINGVLDKAVDMLTANGKIAKSGRGLLDA